MVSIKSTVEVTFNEKSLAEMRALTCELQRFNERMVEDNKRIPGVNPDRPFPPPPTGDRPRSHRW